MASEGLPMPLAGSAEHTICLKYVYCTMELALTARGKLTPADVERLQVHFNAAAEVAPVVACAAAAWLRNKSELGNRLVSAHVIVLAAGHPKTSPLVRAIAPQVFLLPTDLMEATVLFPEIHKRPIAACLRKAATDFFASATEYQLAKYDVRGKIIHARQLLSELKLELVPPPEIAANPYSRNTSARLEFEKKKEQVDKRVATAEAKLKKLRKQDLRQLIAQFHIASPPALVQQILGKRYPATAEEFALAKLPGEFDPARAGQKQHLPAIVTWDRELSEHGNTPRTWHRLLASKSDSGVYNIPYMALLRNLRNILLLGLPTEFLRLHVFTRLTDLKQIRGSGQTPTTLTSARDVLLKEFTPESITLWEERTHDHLRNIHAYYCLRARFTADIIGRSDAVSGVIGEFLGRPIWGACGLEFVNGCFLARREMKIRGTKRTIERRCCIPLHPLTAELIAEVGATLDRAAALAAVAAVRPIDLRTGADPVVVCYDVSNPPVPTTDALALDENETHMCGLKGVEVLNICAGMQVTLSAITMHKKLCFELRYFCTSFIDYNIHAYNKDGKLVWQSTYCDCYSGGEKRNPTTNNVVAIHCRDICANPSDDVPALRTLHLDMGELEDEIFTLMISSQNFSGVCPSSVSIAIRECHNPEFSTLQGGHQPEQHDCQGEVVVACSLTTVLRRGGTAVYGCLYRDFDLNEWVFRNILDQSLQTESRVAAQLTKVLQTIFTNLFNSAALSSTVSPSRSACIRLCQLYQATRGNPNVKVVLVGIPRDGKQPEAIELPLTGDFTSDLELCLAARKRYVDRAVPPDAAFRLARSVLGAADGRVGAFLRLGNNAFFPTEAVAEARAQNPAMRYAVLDMAGHLFRVVDTLPAGNVYLPGASEAVLGLLSSSLAGEGDLVTHVAGFARKSKPGPAAAVAAATPGEGEA